MKTKTALTNRIKGYFARRYRGDDPARACLYWAQAASEVITVETGQRTIIQAGQCSWPIVTPEQDDGVSPTHLSFMWDPEHIASRFANAAGRLPECHIWAAIPASGEIIDMTTRFFPEIARGFRLDWLGPLPPDYFWGTADELPDDRIVYKPNMDAIRLALLMIEESW
jgi:hypothetical protein